MGRVVRMMVLLVVAVAVEFLQEAMQAVGSLLVLLAVVVVCFPQEQVVVVAGFQLLLCLLALETGFLQVVTAVVVHYHR